MLQLTTIFFLIAFSFLAVVHVLAVKLFLYWHFLWFDIPMHFLGGIVVALGLFTLRDFGFFPNTLLKLIPIFLFVLFIALCWEAFDLYIGTSIIGNYAVDTAIDVVMGVFGGSVGYIIGNSLRNLR